MLKSQVKKKFLDLFYHEIKDLILDSKKTRLNLFVLKIQNNKFCYHELVDELTDCVISFGLTRQELSDLKNSLGGKRYLRAVERIKEHTKNEGEVGEILLYCFLESHLNAPKIFTKLALKLSKEDYVKGSDGVHLLKLSDGNFQLIFGESKLNEKLTTSLSEAFKSISDFLKRRKSNINWETQLLNTHLKQESIDDKTYQLLKEIIMPSAKAKRISTDNAFGVFVGFDLKLSSVDKKLENQKFRDEICARIKKEVEEKVQHIKEKIKEHKLEGYAFYVYIFPFIDLEESRKRLIKNLEKATNDF